MVILSMKTEVMLLAIIITLSSILVVTYVQMGNDETSTFDLILHTQFEYRDSNGQLFAYVEVNDPFILDMDALNNFLDS